MGTMENMEIARKSRAIYGRGLERSNQKKLGAPSSGDDSDSYP